MRRALVFAALLCACREKAAQPPPPAEQQAPAAPERVREQEPNDFQRAQQIPARAVVAGTLQAPRDDDWYRIGAGSGKTLALRVEVKGVRDAWLETYDRDRNRLLRVHAGGDDPGVVPAIACLEACFVKISGAGLQEYELTVLGGEPRPGEELEPNDRAVDATELRPGSPVRGTFLTAEDEDWYRLSLPEGSGEVLRIEVTPVEGVRPELEVRALGDATLLATFRGTEGLFVRNLSVHLGETADAGAPDGGPVPAGYYLVLKGKSRHGAPLTPYTLTATVEPGAQDLELEPNDDPEHATPLRETGTGSTWMRRRYCTRSCPAPIAPISSWRCTRRRRQKSLACSRARTKEGRASWRCCRRSAFRPATATCWSRPRRGSSMASGFATARTGKRRIASPCSSRRTTGRPSASRTTRSRRPSRSPFQSRSEAGSCRARKATTRWKCRARATRTRVPHRPTRSPSSSP